MKARKICQQCGEKRPTIKTPYAKWFCKPCWSEEWFTCKVCGNPEDIRDRKRGQLCPDCFDEQNYKR